MARILSGLLRWATLPWRQGGIGGGRRGRCGRGWWTMVLVFVSGDDAIERREKGAYLSLRLAARGCHGCESWRWYGDIVANILGDEESACVS